MAESDAILDTRARKYTLPYRDVFRAQTILLAAQGLRKDAIAAHLNTRREVVSKWRKRFFEEGVAGLDERPRRDRPPGFPPPHRRGIKALACELPVRLGLPLSRLSIADLRAEALQQGVVATISATTIWR